MKQHDKGNGNASKPEKPAVGASQPAKKATPPAKESGKSVTIWAFSSSVFFNAVKFVFSW